MIKPPGRRAGTAGLLVGVVLYLLSCQPKYQRIRLQSGNEFDVISLTQEIASNERGESTSRVLLKYYARARTPSGRVGEANQLLELVVPAAETVGDSLIVIQQTYPFISRWTGIVRGNLLQYRRFPDGKWRLIY